LFNSSEKVKIAPKRAHYWSSIPFMSTQATGQTREPDPCELKASALTLPVLKLYDTNIDQIAQHLRQKAREAPDFFHHAPVVIDLSSLEQSDAAVNFPFLVGIMRGLGMQPIGVQGGSDAQRESAELMELAVLGRSGSSNRTAKKTEETAPKEAATSKKTLLVSHPVRSGQRIYASGADLIVTAKVSSGAEIFADGNIHVYSALRGRAMAGLKGDTSARIFCRTLSAELVSIAGRYKVSEDLANLYWGESVQIYLQGNKLVVETI